MEDQTTGVRVRVRVPTDGDAKTVEAVAAYLRLQNEHPTMPRFTLQSAFLPRDEVTPLSASPVSPPQNIPQMDIREAPIALQSSAAPDIQGAKRRLVLVHGGKGGVGRSITAGLLSAWYDFQGVEYAAYDGDPSVLDFSRFCAKPVIAVDTQDIDSIAPVLDELLDRAGPAIALFDYSARKSPGAFQWLADGGALHAATADELEIIVLFLVDGSTTGVASLGEAVRLLGDRVHWIAAKNMRMADSFAAYNGSNARRELLAAGGIEIEIPEISTGIFQRIDRLNISFSAAGATDEHLGLTQMNFVREFLKAAFKQFDACGTLLRDRT